MIPTTGLMWKAAFLVAGTLVVFGCARPGGTATAVPAAAGPSSTSTGRATTPAAEIEPLTGHGDHVLVRRVDVARATITVDVVQYFTGAAAGRACAEDHVPRHAGGLCDVFYLRDRSSRLSTVRVRRNAAIIVLPDGGAASRPATLAEVGAGLDRHSFFRADIVSGEVSRLTEVATS